MSSENHPRSSAGHRLTAQMRALGGLPRGYTCRPLGEDDIAAVHDLEAAGELFDDGVVELDLSDVEADWRRPGFRPATMSVGVFHGERLVAYATVFGDRAEALVLPENRARGIGTALMRWTWEVARTAGRNRVGQTISENERDAEALFRANGYMYGHTSWILQIDLAGTTVPNSSVLPSGHHFRPYRPGADDREMFTVIDTAFDEWRGSTSESMGFENWVASALYRIDPALVVLVGHDDRIVGTAIGRDYGAHGGGWIEGVAVVKEHRGQGLGRALLEEGFRRFLRVGRRQCGISTDSRTGALGLYERAGMSVRRSYTRWIKEGL